MVAIRKELAFAGRIVMVGFGSIGQGTLPLLLRHIDIRPDQIVIVTGDENGRAVAAEYGVEFNATPLTPANYRSLLEPRLSSGDFLVNCSSDVSSVALVALCQSLGALYVDTCIEPWAGGYTDASVTPGARSNYALRERALTLKRPGMPTAILTHGANPGLVSHLVKEALLNIARDTGHPAGMPQDRSGWAQLARDLNIRTIHIAERDTQVAEPRKAPGEFVNTWSVEGFVGEGCQPAELGWGSHEKHFPTDGRRHESGCRAAIWLNRPGAATQVRTWTPLAGPIHGFLITHSESISLADYLTLGDNGGPVYRPTVHYAYHPSDDTVQSVHELAGRNWKLQQHSRLVKDEIVSGVDELGVLLMGHAKGAYWYGSRLSIQQARTLCPHNSATSLQVTAPVVAGVIWALKNPQRGVVEPEELDHDQVLDFIRPYLGEVVGAYSDWTPLADRSKLFEEDLDQDDPWQFKNFRVA
ncbi:MAG: saccharopine dehydrogenase NADP-binding domain-containing protein [Rhodocyclaceae bacterium]|nr:saccharopine dehydrogenase NADP-binding domain-containing protein [Rhodocyclaceae bacterium]MCO5098473.1 saccharopine dehydrogenase NADP-binding domain-containing protein [Rhodocyclaceae bacterium]